MFDKIPKEIAVTLFAALINRSKKESIEIERTKNTNPSLIEFWETQRQETRAALEWLNKKVANDIADASAPPLEGEPARNFAAEPAPGILGLSRRLMP